MNKKILVASALLMASMTTMADDYNYLTVASGNIEKSIELATVQKITFENGNAVVYTTGENFTFPLSKMQKMTFTMEPTLVKSLPKASENLKYNKGQLQVSAKGTLCIYNAAGALVSMAKVDEKSNVNLSGLTSGLYIIRLGDQTIKIRK